jgi:parvulin-like peptidyl-prolyl isomerase
MKQKILFIIIIGVIVIAAGVWFYFSSEETSEQEGLSESSDIVARVNSQDIGRAELEAFEAQIAAGQGIEVSSLDEETRNQLQEQALDNLISQTLVQQKAEEMGIVATEADIDTQIESIKAQFEDEAEYQEALNQEGFSEAELRKDVADDIVAQKYIDQAIDFESVTVTEEEIEAEYDRVAEANEDLPELSEVRDQIESSIIQQKQQQIVSQHILALQEAADIEILI